ncbi:MAG TPA: tryptophan synthase subunit alpha [Pyrinomonadaceae bacterium]|nr:tryptophan synthase subunit alpha [Pyrinomonadaceae bacterium]
MSRITDSFTRHGRRDRRALIPFIMAGDPDLDTTRRLIVELARAGADLIELGVPFSDPIADGPIIQRAAMRALRNRVGVAQVLEVVADARTETDVPIILFSYFNPLLQLGAARLGAESRAAGLDGVLVTDLIPEEASEFAAAMTENELDCIYLAAPTTTDERLRMIARLATGFVYAVSRAGVTGARTDVRADAERLVARLRGVTTLPVAVGFGISDAGQVAEVWRYADGAVVGSAIVAEMERQAGAPDFVTRIGDFTRALLPPRGGDS